MTSGERDDDPIARAQALAKAGEPRRAADLLRARLAEGRGGILMRLALGRMELAAGDMASALETLREVCELSPGLAEAAFAMGEVLLAANALPAAIAELERALRLDARHHAASLALGRAWLEAGEANRAKTILAPLAQPGSPLADEAASVIAEADRVLSLPRAAPGYVRHLFDQFSADYDTRMLENLSYRAPTILRGLADLMLGAPENPLAILDLGCGTGLAGEAFADLAARLDGIDLSPRMIEKARARGLYDELVVGDLESTLNEGGESYDLLIAADTLVYLGDLSQVFAGAARRLKPGGFFLFTVEKHSGDGYALGPKRRYRHSEAYLREKATQAGLEIMGLLDCSPREEAGEPVAGLALALLKI